LFLTEPRSEAATPLLRKYANDGTELWTHQLGTSASDSASAVGVDDADNIYVVVNTAGTFSGQASTGGDVVLLSYSPWKGG
jgi:Beta-propeller repeat